MKNFKRKLFIGLMVLGLFINLLPAKTSAELDLWGAGGADAVRTGLGYENDALDPLQIIINVIKFLLTFLGIVAVILILWAGWLWMTAGGSEDNVKKSKSIMLNAVIGLVIILAAYGIVNWVLVKLTEVVSTEA